MTDYYNKYLKYRNKYLELKNKLVMLKGGDKPIIDNSDKINLFEDPEMEQLLNPIYGLVLCENGYITNNYFLQKLKKSSDDDKIEFIHKSVRSIPGGVQPTKSIMDNIKPIDIGRYIAIKYFFNKKNITCNITTRGDYNYLYDKRKPQHQFNVITDYLKKFNEILDRPKIMNKYFNQHDEFFYHMLLYFLWWTANNDDGITEYYRGVREIFDMEIFLKDKYRLKDSDDSNFIKILLKHSNKIFKIFNQESVKVDKNGNPVYYADCGETTMRNLINLMCYNGRYFDIDLLKPIKDSSSSSSSIEYKYQPIDELVEYYSMFNTFQTQSLILPQTKTIFGMNLNARDAWGVLITKYANNNIKFVNGNYELDSKMSLDQTVPNFVQLLKNLLPGINDISDINNDSLKIDISGFNTRDGLGIISIESKNYGNKKINFSEGHFYMEDIKSDEDMDYSLVNPTQKEILNIIFWKEPPREDNYLKYFYRSEEIESLINESQSIYEDWSISRLLYFELIELSLTDNYDRDLRRRIVIDLNETDLYTTLEKFKNYEQLNDYTYRLINFEMVYKLYDLGIYTLRYITNNQRKLVSDEDTTIDLSPLFNIRVIGDYFLSGEKNIRRLNLSPLSNVTTISTNFLSSCNSLETLDISPLSNVTTISNNFLSHCKSLQILDLSPLSNVTTIGAYFLFGCESLNEIDLLPLSNITTIDTSNFLGSCIKLKRILNISVLSGVTFIDSNFLSYCTRLEEIDLSALSNITTIGDKFLDNCKSLQRLNLSPLSNITTIGDNFLYYCESLRVLDLSPLSNIITIKNYFLANCNSLNEIDLSPLSNVTTIGTFFLLNCKSLQVLDLSPLSNVTTIGYGFLSGCNRLGEIDLSRLSNLKTISLNFLNKCEINKVILPDNIVEISSSFLKQPTKAEIVCTENIKRIILINNRDIERRHTFTLK